MRRSSRLSVVAVLLVVTGCGSSGRNSSTKGAAGTAAASVVPAGVAKCLALWNGRQNAPYQSSSGGHQASVSTDSRGRCVVVFADTSIGDAQRYVQRVPAVSGYGPFRIDTTIERVNQLSAVERMWNATIKVQNYVNTLAYSPGG